MMRARIHLLLLPDMTACGRLGRHQRRGRKSYLFAGDMVLRVGDRNDATCRLCIAHVAKHGNPINWKPVGGHKASVAKEKRRRWRRRKKTA